MSGSPASSSVPAASLGVVVRLAAEGLTGDHASVFRWSSEVAGGHRSAGATGVSATLSPHPTRGVLIPFVTGIRQSATGTVDLVPAVFVLETAPDQFGDERTSPPRSHSPVDLRYEMDVQSDSQAHSLGKLACGGHSVHSARSWSRPESLQRRRDDAAGGDVVRQRLQDRTFLGALVGQLDQGLQQPGEQRVVLQAAVVEIAASSPARQRCINRC